MKTKVFSFFLAVIILSSCGTYSDWPKVQEDGPIYPGIPSEILGVWHNREDPVKGYPRVNKLYLYTRREDSSLVERKKVSASLFRSKPIGSSIRWEGDEVDSIVENRAYNKTRSSSGYLLAFEVRQCRNGCRVGFVNVDPKTWLKYNKYDWITFAGDPNEDIRD